MNKRALAGVVIAVLTAISGASGPGATAGERAFLPGNQRRRRRSLMCRYASFEQCIASKTSQADRCMLNPRLAGQPIR